MKRTLLASPLLLLAACTTQTGPRPPVSAAPARGLAPGADRVLRQDARTLTAMFGAPALDVREGSARKLQWRGAPCVLDAYLYPPDGGGEPRATWIEARTSNGSDVDRNACIAALAVAGGATPRR